MPFALEIHEIEDVAAHFRYCVERLSLFYVRLFRNEFSYVWNDWVPCFELLRSKHAKPNPLADKFFLLWNQFELKKESIIDCFTPT